LAGDAYPIPGQKGKGPPFGGATQERAGSFRSLTKITLSRFGTQKISSFLRITFKLT
jgi:hypothetical protein